MLRGWTMLPRVLAISDRKGQPGEELRRWLEIQAELETPAVLVREKDLADGELFTLLVGARRLLPPETRLLVSSRPDLALAAGADGIHLPARGLPIEPIRARFGRRLILGRSAHSLSEVEAARREGADYVAFGPVFSPLSKPSAGRLAGLAGLAEATRLGLPVLALGGVRAEHLLDLASSGAYGVASIGAMRERHQAAELLARARALFWNGRSEEP